MKIKRQCKIAARLHFRNHLLPFRIIVEEKLRTQNFSGRKIVKIVRFLTRQSRRYWDESNIEELNQLSLGKLRVFARIDDPFWHLFRTGDSNHVRQFMEHGIFHVPLFKEYFSLPEDERDLQGILKIPSRQGHYMNLLKYRGFISQISSSSHRRLLRVICGIEAIRKVRFTGAPRLKVLCLKILFKYIREPYITSAEVRDIIKCLGREKVSEELLQQICELFEAYFPESARPYQPRSLKHLSRCQVRENMKAVGTHPEGVKMLHIPKLLHTYILIDYLPWIPKELSSYIKFDLLNITGTRLRGVEFRISN